MIWEGKYMLKTTVKIICLLLAVVLTFGLVGCNAEQKPEESTGETPAETTKAPEETTVPPTTEAKESLQEFFDNAAFIGDSVTLKLRNYNTEFGALGNATFLCQGSYSVAHAVNNTMYLSYQGEDMTPQDALKACGANKVFILLGMNDIGLYEIDETIQNWATLIANIRQVNPDMDIYIQSGTPIYHTGETGSLTNARMDEYNVKLKAFAEANNCVYVEIAASMKDSNNGLAKAYCSDDFVHMTNPGCALWVELLSELV